MFNKIIMHINYAELPGKPLGGKSIDEICEFAARCGYDGIEFRGKVPEVLGNISFQKYAEIIAKAKDNYGLSEILFRLDIPECTDESEEKRQEAIAGIIKKAELAKNVCGTKVCNTTAKKYFSPIKSAPSDDYAFHGSTAVTEREWQLTAEAYSQVGKALEKIGVKFAFETHMGYIHDLPETSKRLVDMIESPAVGINMDYGNTVYFSGIPSVEEAIDIYAEKLFYVHLKNSIRVPGDYRRIPTALSDGEINHRSYLSKLFDTGYCGPIGIEAPRSGDRLLYAKQDLNYLKSVIESI